MKNKLILISNMYPSADNVRYGIFVQNFEKIIQENFCVNKIVLTKKNSFLSKLVGYIVFYIKILGLCFRLSPQDIVYVHYPLHAAPVLWPLYLFNKNIFFNFYGSDLEFNTFLKKILSFFLLPLIKKTAMVVPSHYYKNVLEKIIQASHPQILVYPSGGINKEVFYY